MRFATEYRKKDGLYAGTIEAGSWEEAQKLADARGRGEKVIGSHCVEISVTSREEADAVVEAMNERDRQLTH